jgi:flagellar biosynthesis regulator FlbT
MKKSFAVSIEYDTKVITKQQIIDELNGMKSIKHVEEIFDMLKTIRKIREEDLKDPYAITFGDIMSDNHHER